MTDTENSFEIDSFVSERTKTKEEDRNKQMVLLQNLFTHLDTTDCEIMPMPMPKGVMRLGQVQRKSTPIKTILSQVEETLRKKYSNSNGQRPEKNVIVTSIPQRTQVETEQDSSLSFQLFDTETFSQSTDGSQNLSSFEKQVSVSSSLSSASEFSSSPASTSILSRSPLSSWSSSTTFSSSTSSSSSYTTCASPDLSFMGESLAIVEQFCWHQHGWVLGSNWELAGKDSLFKLKKRIKNGEIQSKLEFKEAVKSLIKSHMDNEEGEESRELSISQLKKTEKTFQTIIDNMFHAKGSPTRRTRSGKAIGSFNQIKKM